MCIRDRTDNDDFMSKEAFVTAKKIQEPEDVEVTDVDVTSVQKRSGGFTDVYKRQEEGIEILPVTGRPLCGLPEEVRKIRGLRYAITANGARILDLSLIHI